MRRILVFVGLIALVGMSGTSWAAETDPVPPSQQTPGVAVIGPDATETYGSAGSGFSGTPRERGNVFSVTTPANISQIEWWIGVGGADTFYFVIYRKVNDGTLTGTYDQDFITSISVTTTGDQWLSSGPMSYTLDPGYYYYMSIAWDVASSTYYRGSDTTPFATGFGQLETGIPAGSGHATTWTNTYNPGAFSPYYQRLTFEIVPVELMSLSVE